MKVDRTSFQLGMINCFAEMVAVGVKPLAISPPLEPEEYEKIRGASEEIAEGSGIRSYLETSLLVTHLQTPEFTRGRWSILYYKDRATLDTYLTLKKRKRQLERDDRLSEEADAEISRRFMRLLGYPPEVIEAKIQRGGTSDPYMLDP